MAKSTKQTSNTNDPAALGQAFLKQFEDAGLGSMNWMGTNWFEAMAEMNSEVMSFIAARISEDAKTQQELLQCKSAEELQKAQLAFQVAEAAVEDVVLALVELAEVELVLNQIQ